jgi:predicted amidohydrolase YtcJ
MTGAAPKSDMTVVLIGGRIAALGKTGRVRVPRDAQVIEATGKFLLPGFWDMHFHITEVERTFPLFIANGVTGVRNMGGDFRKLFEWRGGCFRSTLRPAHCNVWSGH